MPEEQNAVVKHDKKVSLAVSMASRFQMEVVPFLETLKKTVFPNGGQGATNEQVASFLAVCQEYELNPFTREIYAFPAKSGGIVPVVSVDGWAKIVNSNPQYDGCEFAETFTPEHKISSITCTMYRKDRGHPTVVTEYFSECYRKTDPWDKMPMRMLRHKAYIQAGRYAFGFAGIFDDNEATDLLKQADGSYEMAAATEEKTVALKDKIGAAQAKPPIHAVPNPAEKPAEEVKEQPKRGPGRPRKEEAPAAQDDQPPIDTHTPEASQAVPKQVSLIDDEQNGDKPITEVERKALIAILQSKATSEEHGQKIAAELKAKLQEKGAAKSSEIRVRDYQGFLDWANGV